ncbi:DUF4265 domain-containing protein [Actinokineospora enzanensis]|uniref:DUF4265 domain-containing protein n=1 Tax=Actinokineospora enzanensis TaxID=155975 RepID=UPI000377A9FF|nr:DUF4265 domain-containing protein [Actinokineospora enzanensis]
MSGPVDEFIYISHPDPVWRPEPAFLAMVELAPFEIDGQREQLWFRRDEAGEYELCCVPFVAPGLALGDRVELDENWFVRGVRSKSGRHVLRLLFTEPRPPVGLPDARPAVVEAVRANGLLAEWNRDRFVAIDIPPGTDPMVVFDQVRAEIDAGSVLWEWSDLEPFRAPGD